MNGVRGTLLGLVSKRGVSRKMHRRKRIHRLDHGQRGYTFPAALQPNHIGRSVSKASLTGDFDESYDAADHNNWFLSQRRTDDLSSHLFTTSVLNYILNEQLNWSAPLPADLVFSLAAARFGRSHPWEFHRRCGFAECSIHGGNSNFALRQPLTFSTLAQMDQFARSLIQGKWMLTMTGMGRRIAFGSISDYRITSPEGKLLKPLVATMIEDLGGRLNVKRMESPAKSSIPDCIRGRQLGRNIRTYNDTTMNTGTCFEVSVGASRSYDPAVTSFSPSPGV